MKSRAASAAAAVCGRLGQSRNGFSASTPTQDVSGTGGERSIDARDASDASTQHIVVTNPLHQLAFYSKVQRDSGIRSTVLARRPGPSVTPLIPSLLSQRAGSMGRWRVAAASRNLVISAQRASGRIGEWARRVAA
jgi:hypothetical protein